MSPLVAPIFRLEGAIAARWVVSGKPRPPLTLRALRFVTDLYTMHAEFGLRGVVDVFRDRLGLDPTR